MAGLSVQVPQLLAGVQREGLPEAQITHKEGKDKEVEKEHFSHKKDKGILKDATDQKKFTDRIRGPVPRELVRLGSDELKRAFFSGCCIGCLFETGR